LYKELKDSALQYEIAKYYGFKSVNTFLNYMEVLRNVRNTCAHNAALFDISLPLSIANGPAGKMEGDKNKLSGAIKVLSYMISRVLFRGSSCEIKEIITKCSGIALD
ncbi:MAG: Abi family protein, partial [Clostridiales bacterium]